MDGSELDDVKLRYIEIIQTFEIELIIADTKWIYATYPAFGFVVKQKVPKMCV
jgi:hypothetical protein